MSVSGNFFALLFCPSLGSVMFYTISLNHYLSVLLTFCPSVQSLGIPSSHHYHSAVLVPCLLYLGYDLHGRVTVTISLLITLFFLSHSGHLTALLFYSLPYVNKKIEAWGGGQWLVVVEY